MSDSTPEPIVVALALKDANLADRLVALLAGVPGLQLAEPGQPGDVTLCDGDAAANGPDESRSDESRSDMLDQPLTPREVEVLALLAEGASNKSIAVRLGISAHTAKFHVGQLLDKLDATGRTDAVAHAARIGVLNL